MSKNLLLNTVLLSLVFCVFQNSLSAQIIVNGYNPTRNLTEGPGHALSISYGNIIWVDGDNVPLPGYSSSLSGFHDFSTVFSIEKANVSTGITVGYERQLTKMFAVRASFSTAKLTTGAVSRLDLIATDKSKITQLGLYSRYSLTRNLKHRFQFQWLAGPELLYAKKNVFVEEYVVDETSTPQTYNQNITIVEGAVVTGLGLSFRVSNAFTLFSDGMIGISLPGKGLKTTNSGFGLKYMW